MCVCVSLSLFPSPVHICIYIFMCTYIYISLRVCALYMQDTRLKIAPTPGRDICVSCALEDILEPMTWRVICCGEAATEEALEEERERLRICLDRRGRLIWETKMGGCHPTINVVYPFTITSCLINVIGYITIVTSHYQWVRS